MRVCIRLGQALAMAFALGCGVQQAAAAAAMSRQGLEFRMTAPLGGDQVNPHLDLTSSGGYVVWEDNATDGSGIGISARRVDASLSGSLGVFRVNQIGAGDQERPKVAMLRDGGALFVWQGGSAGAQRIYGRIATVQGTFATGDIQLSAFNTTTQTDPSVAALEDGSAVVVWASSGQDGSMNGVFGQRLGAKGAKLGTEFAINQYTPNNQRTPAVAALKGGGFVVAWISERYRTTLSSVNQVGGSTDPEAQSDIYDVLVMGRRYDAAGAPLGDEFTVSSAARIAANPVVCVARDGAQLFAWSARQAPLAGTSTSGRSREGWDVFARGYALDGSPTGAEYRLNQHSAGDQICPKLAPTGDQFVAVWTSVGQDGSREGVFGRSAGRGGAVGEEAQVNGHTQSQQIYPTVASAGDGSALVVWTSFIGGAPSFDLFAQRVVGLPEIAAPQAPFLLAASQSRLNITWPAVDGLGPVTYLLYLDGNTVPLELAENRYLLTGLVAGSSHSATLAYRLADGRTSPVSEASTARTWGEDLNFDALPDDWQALYWPGAGARVPGAKVDSDGDGANNLQELLAGTNPADPNSALKLELDATAQGTRLAWNTAAGAVYAVQVSDDLETWAMLGSERLATGARDSVSVAGDRSVQMYRIVRIR